jgi:hypothetical protein
MPEHPHHHIKDLEALADWMDSKFIVPGTKYRFGLDSLVGLIPGIGDTVGLAVSAYIYHRARQHDLPLPIKTAMIRNIVLDWLIGMIPFAGDLFDIGWKANRRNLDLLKRHLDKKAGIIDVEPSA